MIKSELVMVLVTMNNKMYSGGHIMNERLNHIDIHQHQLHFDGLKVTNIFKAYEYSY